MSKKISKKIQKATKNRQAKREKRRSWRYKDTFFTLKERYLRYKEGHQASRPLTISLQNGEVFEKVFITSMYEELGRFSATKEAETQSESSSATNFFVEDVVTITFHF